MFRWMDGERSVICVFLHIVPNFGALVVIELE